MWNEETILLSNSFLSFTVFLRRPFWIQKVSMNSQGWWVTECQISVLHIHLPTSSADVFSLFHNIVAILDYYVSHFGCWFFLFNGFMAPIAKDSAAGVGGGSQDAAPCCCCCHSTSSKPIKSLETIRVYRGVQKDWAGYWWSSLCHWTTPALPWYFCLLQAKSIIYIIMEFRCGSQSLLRTSESMPCSGEEQNQPTGVRSKKLV